MTSMTNILSDMFFVPSCAIDHPSDMPLDTQTVVQRHIQMEVLGTKNGTAFLCHLHHVFKSPSSGSIAVQPQRALAASPC